MFTSAYGIPFYPTRRAARWGFRVAVALLLAAVCFIVIGMMGCAQPGQPPNLGNAIVGTVEIIGGEALIDAGNNRLQTAFMQGKISQTEYDTLYKLETTALADVQALGTATANNTPITQAQIDTAVASFLAPLNQLVPVTLPPELPPAVGGSATRAAK